MESARERFLMRNPFLGVVAMGMPWLEAVTVRSIASDGASVYYNPDFVKGAEALLLEGHILHAVLHWALGHAWRGLGKDPGRWRAACDLSLVPLFLRTLYPYQEILPLKAPVELARERSVEEIYALLPEAPAEEGARGVHAEIEECWHDPSEGEGPSRGLADRWRERLVRAAQSMAYTGSGDPFGEEVLEGLAHPRLDWRAKLALFVQRTYAQDYSWIPPNRRYLPLSLYLPGTRTRSVGDLVVAVDTSGSIDPATAGTFLAEVSAISDLVGGSGRLFVLEADDEVRGFRQVVGGSPLPLTIRGRGGTDFRPTFRFLDRQGEARPSGVVYLTDGAGEFPSRPPGYPVLWVVPEFAEVPFGERVVLPGI